MRRILMRVDLNSSVVNGKVVSSERIEQVSRILKNYKNDIVVLLAHQGRKGGNDFISLEQHAKLLKVKFVNDLFGNKAVSMIKTLKKGDVLLLENVRFYDEEYKLGVNKFIKNLVPLFDIYINNAFSASLHTNQTSVMSFPLYLPSYKGELMKEEIKNLSKLKDKKAVYVLGGVKMEEVYPLMKYVLEKNKAVKILTAGHLCLILQNKMNHELADKFKDLFKKYKSKIILPIDYAIEVNGKRKNVDVETTQKVMDIGDKTIKSYKKIIETANCVFVKGSAGVYEKKAFWAGTKEILKASIKAKTSIIGGGDTVSGIKMFKLSKNKFSYVSLSGGAMLAYLSGQELPGIKLLKG